MSAPEGTERTSTTPRPVPEKDTGGRVVVTTAFGAPDTLRITSRPTHLDPGPAEAVIQVQASSATLSDSIVRRGLSPYLGAVQPPFVLGYDLVGTVTAVGSAVTHLAPGQRVVNLVRWGANADFVRCPADDLTPVADDIDPVLLEALVMTGITAYQMVHRVAHVRPGQWVLVHGASGGVGLLCADLALAAGAQVIGTASPGKHAPLRARGIHAIDRHGDLRDAVRAIAPGGMDVVVDGAGGPETARVAALLGDVGMLVAYGFAGPAAGAPVRSSQAMARLGVLMADSARDLSAVAAHPGHQAEMYEVGDLRATHRDWYDEDLASLVDMVRQGRLCPAVRPVALPDIVAAHVDLDRGRPIGRLVVDHSLVGPAR